MFLPAIGYSSLTTFFALAVICFFPRSIGISIPARSRERHTSQGKSGWRRDFSFSHGEKHSHRALCCPCLFYLPHLVPLRMSMQGWPDVTDDVKLVGSNSPSRAMDASQVVIWLVPMGGWGREFPQRSLSETSLSHVATQQDLLLNPSCWLFRSAASWTSPILIRGSDNVFSTLSGQALRSRLVSGRSRGGPLNSTGSGPSFSVL